MFERLRPLDMKQTNRCTEKKQALHVRIRHMKGRHEDKLITSNEQRSVFGWTSLWAEQQRAVRLVTY